ncbi:Disease resistance RPH8A-like protein [Gossypium australe]|uniref:Disease resistance RPH8A-like protein n=1 Tax=Gossypium australe TaxID=47621 RepID=A0A5B6W4K0_9ROSI|nr:Disease resistance RPH8A-like protein [Gossypium australe]
MKSIFKTPIMSSISMVVEIRVVDCLLFSSNYNKTDARYGNGRKGGVWISKIRRRHRPFFAHSFGLR